MPDQFSEPCAANPDAVRELAFDGSLITMRPPVAKQGSAIAALSLELRQANGARPPGVAAV
jgi:Uma2 family endonuclease